MDRGNALKPGGRMTAVASTASVVIAWLILVRIWDAPVGSSLLYLGFLTGWVVLPGVLVFRALVPDPGGPLRQVAIGCALGYVLGAFAFMFTELPNGARTVQAASGLIIVGATKPLMRKVITVPAGIIGPLRMKRLKPSPSPHWPANCRS